MKKLLLVIVMLGFVFAAKAQSKSVALLKEKYKGHEDFFNMELGGNFMNFAEGFKIDIDENDMATVAKSIEKLQFYKLPEHVDQNRTEFKALKKGLEKERYELLMEMADEGEIVIYSKGGKNISDLVVLVGGDEGDLMVVELKGSFDQKVIAKAIEKDLN